MEIHYSVLTPKKIIVVILMLLFYCLMVALAEAGPSNIKTDHTALLAFRTQLHLNPSHILFHNWSDSTPICSWFGVTCASFKNHQRVSALNISRMELTGYLIPQLANISFLVSLDLSFNNFQGQLPRELIQLRGLRFLDLRRNNIHGELPSWLATFPRLQVLNLRNNSFTSVIQPSLFNMSSLQLLGLSFNLLHGRIPQEMGSLQNLQVLGLAGNQLNGPIPVKLFELPKLQILILSYNSLRGSIPREVGNSTQLEEIYLSYNRLSGEIPSDLLNISALRILTLTHNQLTGNIPSNIGHNLPDIEVLNLSGNNLTSETTDLSFITSLTNCRYLKDLTVNDNPLNGRFPSSIGNFSSSLEGIYAYNCGLQGTIPNEIANLSNLITVGLSQNHLIGSLPKTLSNLQYLQALDLQLNKLDGTIPSTMCNFLYLYVLALNENRFVNSIPDCIQNLTSLRILQLGNNKLNSSIPLSLWHLQDLQQVDLSSNAFVGSLPQEIGNLRAATLIDFSGNQLSGIIPSTLGGLNTLTIFLLNDNRFQGSIPESIGQMVSLENLDLSQNNLSGQIPASFVKLQHLHHFNVSFNNLSGEIPTDGPFRNFTTRSFMSNKGLCGDVKYLVRPCPTIPVARSKQKSKLHIILIPLGILGVILAMLFLIFAFARYKRQKRDTIGSDHWSGPTSTRFSYYELLQATNSYSESNLIGSGSFGSVYRGTLRNGKDVAVKVFSLQSEGATNSFQVECEILRKLRHRNLCKVFGSCSNQDFKALVLEYMPTGSLETCLYSDNYSLDIIQRISIMIDIASALEYLHYDYSTPVIHCDLKPRNVLLDNHMAAHLCDFGIAKLLHDGESVVRTMTLATLGYIAPELGVDGLASRRSDVYSYGIIMMEVFTRVKPNDERFAGNSSLRSWIKDSMPDAIIHITDPKLFGSNEEFFRDNLNYLSSIFELALCCTMESPSERINIKDVRVALEKIKHQVLSNICGKSKK